MALVLRGVLGAQRGGRGGVAAVDRLLLRGELGLQGPLVGIAGGVQGLVGSFFRALCRHSAGAQRFDLGRLGGGVQRLLHLLAVRFQEHLPEARVA
jgi:hypothetical protein